MKPLILLFICFLLSPNLTAQTDFCCTFSEGYKLFSESRHCDEQDTRCCQNRPPSPFSRRRLVKVEYGGCENGSSSLSAVEVCQAPTRYRQFAPFAGVVIDGVTETLELNHAWIRTPHVEAGMGPRDGLMVWTEWRDHQGLGKHPAARCYALPGCNEQCVERAMQIGESTGLYSAINTCQHLVNRVLEHCGCYDVCVARSPRGGYCTEWAWPKLKPLF